MRSYWYRLETIARNADLDNSEQVSRFVSYIKGSNGYKETFVKAYTQYVRLDGLAWQKPKYKYGRKMPKVPTKEKS